MSNGDFLKYEDEGREFAVPEGTKRIGELAFAGADRILSERSATTRS